MKNTVKKLLVLIIAAFMIATALVACDKPPVENPNETPESSPVKIPEKTEPPIEDVDIFENGVTNYKVIRAQSASQDELDATSTIVKALKEKTGVSVLASDDWVNEALGYTESEYEIVVGKTNRPASEQVYAQLRTDDYAVSIVGKKIVIAAFSGDKLNEAVNYFLDNLTESEGKYIFLAENSKINRADYAIDEVTIGGKELSNFRVVYKNGASESVKNAAIAITDKLYEYGYNISTVLDTVKENECEIIIGGTNRGASAAINSDLLAYDYKIYLEGTKLYVLSGSHPDSINAVVEALVGKLAGLLKDGKIAVDTTNIKVDFESDVYKTKQVLINGVDIKEYTVVYVQNDKQSLMLADRFCDLVEKVCGRRLNLVSDSRAYSGGRELIIGYSKRLTTAADLIGDRVDGIKDDEYLLFSEGNFIYAGGKIGQKSAVTAAMNILFNALENVSDPECTKIKLDVNEGKKVGGSKYSVITYNDGDNRTTKLNQISVILKEYMPDFICFQETQTPHAETYKLTLREYDYVLYDNDGTTYNSQPVYWKKDKFELVDSGIKWLSDTPDKRSKYPDSDYTRSFTYAVLKDKATGEEMVIISTHTDYTDTAVPKQTAKLMELVAELGFRNKPVLIMGDFNMRDSSTAYQNMSNECFVDSGRYLGVPNPATIDFIFVDVTSVVPTDYKVISDHEFSNTASDHYPVYAEFVLGFN